MIWTSEKKDVSFYNLSKWCTINKTKVQKKFFGKFKHHMNLHQPLSIEIYFGMASGQFLYFLSSELYLLFFVPEFSLWLERWLGRGLAEPLSTLCLLPLRSRHGGLSLRKCVSVSLKTPDFPFLLYRRATQTLSRKYTVNELSREVFKSYQIFCCKHIILNRIVQETWMNVVWLKIYFL